MCAKASWGPPITGTHMRCIPPSPTGAAPRCSGTPGAGAASHDHPGGDAELLVATPGFLLELQICHRDPRAGMARRGTQLTVLWLLLLPVPTCRST